MDNITIRGIPNDITVSELKEQIKREILTELNRVKDKKMEYLKKYQSRRVKCELCGKEMPYSSMWVHKRSKQHIANVSKQDT